MVIKRGRNKEFLHGMINIIKKNYGIIIDKHEIDLSLSHGENWNILVDKYIRCKCGSEDY